MSSASWAGSRVQLNDRATAERVGRRDISVWLRERAAGGAPMGFVKGIGLRFGEWQGSIA
ncbi:hypothetical protein ACIQWL_42555 [Streptomyces mirabilis]|uniref:hypothetical protein n=1 Tax=Streptomyces mirabilis TaxID=68239 RepID=UPI0033F2B6B8